MPLAPLQNAFSQERVRRYLEWSGQNPNEALRLYTLNAQLSEGLYIPLQVLELSLRNKIHSAMTEKFGEDWLRVDGAWLHQKQKDKIASALVDLTYNRKAHTPGQIVSALSFGFWTAFAGKEYEALWRQTLYQIGRKPNGRNLSRKDLSGPLTTIRKLRNRIAHHEPILHYDLSKHHADICQIIAWLSPEAEQWRAGCDRFPSLYQANIYQLTRAA